MYVRNDNNVFFVDLKLQELCIRNICELIKLGSFHILANINVFNVCSRVPSDRSLPRYINPKTFKLTQTTSASVNKASFHKAESENRNFYAVQY